MILVTGATGNIGSEVVRGLIEAGQPIRALVRDPQKAASLQEMGVELVEGDFESVESLDRAMQGVDKAFLLSAISPKQTEWQANFVEAAKRAGVHGIVKLSGAGASENSPELFARWHWQTEQYIRQSGLAFTFVQPIYFMQNFLGFLEPIRRFGKIFAPIKPDFRFNLVDVRDIAAVATQSLLDSRHEGQTYFVTGPDLLSFPECSAKLAAATGLALQFVEVTPQASTQQLTGAGMPQWLAEGVVELYETLSTDLTDDVARVTGRPPISFDQFVQDYAGAFKV